MEGQIPDLYVLAGRLARADVLKATIMLDDEGEPITDEEIDEILDDSIERAAKIITAQLEPQFAA